MTNSDLEQALTYYKERMEELSTLTESIEAEFERKVQTVMNKADQTDDYLGAKIHTKFAAILALTSADLARHRREYNNPLTLVSEILNELKEEL